MELPKMDFILDAETPRNTHLSPKYKRSFAYPTMTERLPVILTKIIDYLSREKDAIIKSYGQDVSEEIKSATGGLSQLKNELLTSKQLTPLRSNFSDVEQWNEDLKKKCKEHGLLTFFEIDWLFSECYCYRRVMDIFALQKHLCSFDPYSHQKSVILKQSLPAIAEVIKFFVTKRYLDQAVVLSTSEIESILSMLTKNSLWSNRVDLCLSGGSTDFSHFNIANELQKWDSRILVDDTCKIYPALLSNDIKERTIDYVLDNSGYELLSDLMLADFLVLKCNIVKIKFHVKAMPWFVSDCTEQDFRNTVQTIANFEETNCQVTGKRWQKYLDSGKWVLCDNTYWCSGLAYTHMSEVNPKLYCELQKAVLIIFKGDLNYRKLVQDINWEPSVCFDESLGDFHPAPLVALRTCKADTIAGLEYGVAERAAKISLNWMVSGEFGVIQFDAPNT